MSTEWFCNELDEPNMDTRFVRFCGRTAEEAQRTGRCRSMLEFGTMSNFEAVCAMFDMGFTFSPVGEWDDRCASRQALEEAMAAGDVTFGRFPVAVVAGSESEWRFTTEGDA